MINNNHQNLFIFLAPLTKDQRKRFAAYLASPYHVSNKQLLLFWQIIRAELDKGREEFSPVLAKRLYRKIYPKGRSELEKQHRVLRNLATELLNALEAFLAQEVYQHDALQQAVYTYRALNAHIKHSSYRLEYKRFESIFEQQQDTLAKYQLQHQLNWETLNIQHHHQQHTSGPILDDTISKLDTYYLTQKLLYSIQVNQNQQKDFFQHPPPLIELQELTMLHDPVFFERFPILCQAYLLLYHITTKPEKDKWHQKLEKFLEEDSKLLEQKGRREFVTSIINHYYRQFLEGKIAFRARLIHIYELAIMHDWLILEEGLESRHFENLITLAVQEGNIEQAKNYIHRFGQKLIKSQRALAIGVSNIRLAILDEDTRKAQQIVHEMNKLLQQDTDYLFEVKVRISQIQILFLRNRNEDVEDLLLNSLLHFIKYVGQHPQLPSSRKKRHLEFAYLVKALTQIDTKNKEAMSQLKQELEQRPNATLQSWLKDYFYRYLFPIK